MRRPVVAGPSAAVHRLGPGRGPGAGPVFDAEVAIVGAGAAGLSLADRFARAVPGSRAPSVLLLETPRAELRPPRRTWCFWEAGPGPYDGAATASWRHLRVRGPRGEAVIVDIAPQRYKMLGSDDFDAFVGRRLKACPRVRRAAVTVESVLPLSRGAEITGTDAAGAPVRLRARWVYDSRPPDRLPAARTTLLQHFHGWFVRTRDHVFDPVVDLMDFRTPQPARGLSFGYVLPFGRHEALVEYTEFSPAVLDAPIYEAALREYTGGVLRLGPLEVTGTETGVIPMTDARFARETAESVFRIGAAGGATRASTGYTFSAVQRQSRAIVAAYRGGRRPVPPPAHTARSRAMDAVLLRALDTGRVDGAEFFLRLFRQVPAERLLRFLDGATRPHEELAIGLRTPIAPMLRTAAECCRPARRPRAAR